jgi:lipopolysaccharide transport system ATP-binding protein
MSGDAAIRVEGLGKRYELGQQRGGYELLTEKLRERISSIGKPRPREEDFWALRDVGFEVERGETFGIVGRNGAGKSTLLKILSRVTPPTEGQAHLNGRVGALLEVGTGFHPELTGRENVFLNGAILGMARSDIRRKFDEIVAFADVERFIDTPVKRYSSGMQLRLAFSVAAHLEPEILIIDEVLSVGDLAFQQRCLGRMEEVAHEGRTVLFVSHNLSAVRSLCQRAVLLSGGSVEAEGTAESVLNAYVQGVQADAGIDLADRSDRQGNGRLRFTSIHFESEGVVAESPVTGKDFQIVLGYETADGTPLRNVNFSAPVLTYLDEVMLYLHSETAGKVFDELPAVGEVRVEVPRCPLPAGQYKFNLWADIGGEPLDWVESAAEMTVSQGDFFGTGREPPTSHRSVLVDQAWSVAPPSQAGSGSVGAPDGEAGTLSLASTDEPVQG